MRRIQLDTNFTFVIFVILIPIKSGEESPEVGLLLKAEDPCATAKAKATRGHLRFRMTSIVIHDDRKRETCIGVSATVFRNCGSRRNRPLPHDQSYWGFGDQEMCTIGQVSRGDPHPDLSRVAP